MSLSSAKDSNSNECHSFNDSSQSDVMTGSCNLLHSNGQVTLDHANSWKHPDDASSVVTSRRLFDFGSSSAVGLIADGSPSSINLISTTLFPSCSTTSTINYATESGATRENSSASKLLRDKTYPNRCANDLTDSALFANYSNHHFNHSCDNLEHQSSPSDGSDSDIVEMVSGGLKHSSCVNPGLTYWPRFYAPSDGKTKSKTHCFRASKKEAQENRNLYLRIWKHIRKITGTNSLCSKI